MKPSELIERLQEFVCEDPKEELDVVFLYDYGDYHRHLAADEVSDVSWDTLEYSPNIRKFTIVSNRDDSEEHKDFVVLS